MADAARQRGSQTELQHWQVGGRGLQKEAVLKHQQLPRPRARHRGAHIVQRCHVFTSKC